MQCAKAIGDRYLPGGRRRKRMTFPERVPRSWRQWLALGSVGVLAACGGSSVADGTGPGTKPDSTQNPNPGGTVQRGTITVQLAFDPGDVGTATTAGVTLAGIPVTLLWVGTAEAPRTATTDANGIARFEGLLQGSYAASVKRTLSAAELARLPETQRDAALFAGGVSSALDAGARITLTLPLVAARRGGLMISEIFSYNGEGSGNTLYNFGDYIEIYNNGDTTAYLDGLLLSFSAGPSIHSYSYSTCAYNAQWRLDANHWWTTLILGFPGSGRDYPVPPGEGRVVAMDAINHTVATGSSSFPDLSRAQFEQYMSDADTDNPTATNMLRILGSTGILGRGYRNASGMSLALLRPVDASRWITSEYQAEYNPVPGAPPARQTFTGLPATELIDVMSMAGDPVFLNAFGLENSCSPWIAPQLDLGVANIHRYSIPQAIRRKSLGLNAQGKEVLQRTRNSNRDFEYGPLLRRTLNR